jgi:hypothetical protein
MVALLHPALQPTTTLTWLVALQASTRLWASAIVECSLSSNMEERRDLATSKHSYLNEWEKMKPNERLTG